MGSKLSAFLAELKRRKVYRVAVVYVGVGAPVVLGAREVFEGFGISPVVWQVVAVAVALGFPIALVLAWAYELRPEEPPGSSQPGPEASATPPLIAPFTPVVSAHQKSIVVLPFENLSPDPEHAFFADGLTEELILDLSKVGELRVISRTSAMSFKGSQRTVPAIAKELNVRYALEGSVRRAGDSVRITAQLIDTQTDDHLWAERYTGNLVDVFEMQEKTSRAIVHALEIELTRGEEKRLQKDRPSDIEAYDRLLRARQEWQKGSAGGYRAALELLQQAQQLAGENPEIHVGLAEAYFGLSHADTRTLKGYMAEVKEHADKILHLDPHSAPGHIFTALWLYTERRNQEAFLSAKRALAFDPTNFWVLFFIGFWGAQYGKLQDADWCSQRLMEIDPLNPFSSLCRGVYRLFGDGRSDLAVGPLRKAHEMSPASALFGFKYARALAATGDVDRACQVLRHVEENSTAEILGAIAPVFRYALQDDGHKALEVLTPELKATAFLDPTVCWHLASACALIGEKKLAVDFLERTVELGFINYPFFSEIDPLLAGIRQEPRFRVLMEKTKRIWEAFPDYPGPRAET